MSALSHHDRTLVVVMAGEVLGEIYCDRPGRVRLRYDEAYRAADDAVPLSVSMPVVAARHKNSAVGPWLDNLLPDDPQVRLRWRREFGISDLSPFALLRHVGEDVAGAAQFVRPERVPEATRGGELIPLDDAAVAARLEAIDHDPTAWEPDVDTGRFSLAGSQPKFALHRGPGGWGIPTGRLPTTHILKPAMRGLVDQDVNEHVCMQAARNLGLPVPRSQIIEFEERRAFVVARYDRRRKSDGSWVRVHQEDMCQALGVAPENKYEDAGGPSAIDVIGVIRRNVQDQVAAGRDVTRFVDALAYNWVIAGTDAHAKNYALLLAPGQIRLAPFYDLNSLLPYVDRLSTQRLAMRLGRDPSRPLARVGIHEWRAFAEEAGLAVEMVLDRVTRMAKSAPAAFRTAADAPDVRALGSAVPARLADAVEERALVCARTL